MVTSASLRQLESGDIFPAVGRPLSSNELNDLWRIFSAINQKWSLFCDDAGNASEHALYRVRSSWREFVRLRANPEHPWQGASYIKEYQNAIEIVYKLSDRAFDLLFAVGTKYAEAPPADVEISAECLRHAKYFVVNEFMSVMVATGGFKHFGGRNYNGYMAGSRSNRTSSIAAPFTNPKRGGGQ
jgi:hypothetical protein